MFMELCGWKKRQGVCKNWKMGYKAAHFHPLDLQEPLHLTQMRFPFLGSHTTRTRLAHDLHCLPLNTYCWAHQAPTDTSKPMVIQRARLNPVTQNNVSRHWAWEVCRPSEVGKLVRGRSEIGAGESRSGQCALSVCVDLSKKTFN